MNTKLKSRIPWGNYIMQKYGRGLFLQITKQAADTISSEKYYRRLKTVEKPVWMSSRAGIAGNIHTAFNQKEVKK